MCAWLIQEHTGFMRSRSAFVLLQMGRQYRDILDLYNLQCPYINTPDATTNLARIMAMAPGELVSKDVEVVVAGARMLAVHRLLSPYFDVLALHPERRSLSNPLSRPSE